jgi:hypothetical protein
VANYHPSIAREASTASVFAAHAGYKVSDAFPAKHPVRVLNRKSRKVKQILISFSYPYNRRIVGQHGNFTMKDYGNWLKKAERSDLEELRRLAQLNQSKSTYSKKTSVLNG